MREACEHARAMLRHVHDELVLGGAVENGLVSETLPHSINEVVRMLNDTLREKEPSERLPTEVLVLDGRRDAKSSWALRVLTENGTDFIELEGCVTIKQAFKAARDRGYHPTHWCSFEGLDKMVMRELMWQCWYG